MAGIGELTIGHSPDADDAFMFYAITHDLVGIGDGARYRHREVLEDIQSLNERALRAELDMTAISAAVYPDVAADYQILCCGASMGLGYGPLVVSREPCALPDLAGKRVAMPGPHTTAFMLSKMFLPTVEAVQLPFDQVMEPVADGELAAAVVIHEGQLTYVDAGLYKICDLGQVWFEETGLPLPLGLDCVKRSLPSDLRLQLLDALQGSIRAAFANNAAAVDYALQFGRGIDAERGEKFAKMYVNDLTYDMGDDGVAALAELYRRAAAAEIIPAAPPVDVLFPG
ncbi:MAG: ABC transporter substrate-binding protein [Chloroflexi bacterium]|nr:ABC transporter substrate-binding protein [Chloroflexota bacterium]MDE2702864.1 ABC transporter substrate-binding protein [Chloroflexota bacterium]MDE2937015.1 ABC transporter substrate-binding protein [Chloroflexota bacterium]MXW28127.1 ABC transporter substrate-binding protein [Chloroflexota bacterium]MXX66745.1 ABC transporter substrate-binding protein [Chloroflexota bacterium]